VPFCYHGAFEAPRKVPPLDIPPVIHLRQTHPQSAVSDVAGEVRRLWQASSLPRRIKPGMSVGVGIGSRGIANLQTMTRATLDFLRELGAKPFIVAAMGSHGGATSEGQRELLAGYGISEAELGVPVKTDMAAVQIGTNSWGEPVWWDKNALAADAIIALSRIKPHTDFRGSFESGILKMVVIGLGKRDGAAQHHRWGWRGLRDMLPESGKVVLEKTPFVASLGILENAREETARLQVVDKDQLLAVEPKLLDEARQLMGRLPFDQLDLLIIGEIGKNYSGAGIDPNVVGRLQIEAAPELEFEKPRITRICALDLSPESHGNATGVGLADLTTDRMLKAIDQIPFRMNNLTACFLWRSKLPFAFPTDRECILNGVATCWQPDVAKLRMAVIPNTLEVAEVWVSPPLAAEAQSRPHLQLTGDAKPLPFDAAGKLRQAEMFPHSVRGRRQAK
jgi:Lactate racemase N-terminal domain